MHFHLIVLTSLPWPGCSLATCWTSLFIVVAWSKQGQNQIDRNKDPRQRMWSMELWAGRRSKNRLSRVEREDFTSKKDCSPSYGLHFWERQHHSAHVPAILIVDSDQGMERHGPMIIADGASQVSDDAPWFTGQDSEFFPVVLSPSAHSQLRERASS